MGAKSVSLSINDTNDQIGSYGQEGRRRHQAYLEVLDIQSEDGCAMVRATMG